MLIVNRYGGSAPRRAEPLRAATDIALVRRRSPLPSPAGPLPAPLDRLVAGCYRASGRAYGTAARSGLPSARERAPRFRRVLSVRWSFLLSQDCFALAQTVPLSPTRWKPYADGSIFRATSFTSDRNNNNNNSNNNRRSPLMTTTSTTTISTSATTKAEAAAARSSPSTAYRRCFAAASLAPSTVPLSPTAMRSTTAATATIAAF